MRNLRKNNLMIWVIGEGFLGGTIVYPPFLKDGWVVNQQERGAELPDGDSD